MILLILIVDKSGSQLFFCFVHDTADIAEASPSLRMPGLAIAGSVLFLIQDALQNVRNSVIGDNILYEIFLGISETKTDIIIHGYFPLALDNT
jgi:hypothetical protein